MGKYGNPINPSSAYKKFYSTKVKTFKIAGVHLFPIGDVKTVNAMNFSRKLSLYTEEGRKIIYDKLKPNVSLEISGLMKEKLAITSKVYLLQTIVAQG